MVMNENREGSNQLSSFIKSDLLLSNPTILFLDWNYRIQYATRQVAISLGFRNASQLYSKTIFDLEVNGIHKSFIERCIDEITKVSCYQTVEQISINQKSDFWYYIEITKVQRSNLNGYIVVVKNIQYQVIQEEQLNETIALKEEQIQRLLHDIRTAMNALMGSIQTLRQMNLESKEKQLLVDNFNYTSSMICTIVQEISDQSEYRMDGNQIQNEEYDLLETMNQFLGVVEVLTSKYLSVSIETSLPRYIVGDPNQMLFLCKNILLLICDQTVSQGVDIEIRSDIENDEYVFLLELSCNQKDIKEVIQSLEWEHLCDNACYLGGELQVINHTIQLKCPWRWYTEEHALEQEFGRTIVILVLSNRGEFRNHMKRICSNLGFIMADGSNQAFEQCDYWILDKEYYDINLVKNMTVIQQKRGIIYTSIKHVNGPQVTMGEKMIYAPIHEIKLATTLMELEEDTPFVEEQFFQTEGVHALIVDDNKVNCYVLSNMLAGYKIECTECLSGLEALEALKQHEFDLVFVDYRMPSMSGTELVQYIRTKINEDQVIIMVSANIMTEMSQALRNIKINGLLTKPIQLKELENVLLMWIPREKIQYCVKDEDTPILHNSLKDIMSQVTNLNIDRSMERFRGDESKYATVLHYAVHNLDESIQQLQIVKEKESVLFQLHSIKGILLNIDESCIGEEIKELEHSIQCYGYQYYCEDIKQINEKLKHFVNQLRQCIGQLKKEEAFDQEVLLVSKEEFYEHKEYTLQKIKEYNYYTALEQLKQLQRETSTAMQQDISQVIEYVRIFQYEKAYDLLEKVSYDRGEA